MQAMPPFQPTGATTQSEPQAQARGPDPTNSAPPTGLPHKGLTRREFIRKAALTAGAASFAARGLDPAFAQQDPSEAPALTKVVRIKSERVIGPRGIHEDLLLDLLEGLLRRVTGAEDGAAAWHTVLKPDDVVALKFNRSGAMGLGTTDAMLRVLVRSLGAAGFSASQLVAVETTPAIRKETGTSAPSDAWSAARFDFGSGQDNLASWLDDVTAIVNVPFLKHHNFAGMTCCLKNLSHALVKHPAQFHGNGCAPYIGDIVALPQIRGKLRLHIVNGLRVVFENGPEAQEDCIWEGGLLLGSLDPVALDAVGLQVLDHVRSAVGLPEIAASGPPAYLEAAAARGLGTAALHRIELEKVTL